MHTRNLQLNPVVNFVQSSSITHQCYVFLMLEVLELSAHWICYKGCNLFIKGCSHVIHFILIISLLGDKMHCHCTTNENTNIPTGWEIQLKSQNPKKNQKTWCLALTLLLMSLSLYIQKSLLYLKASQYHS